MQASVEVSFQRYANGNSDGFQLGKSQTRGLMNKEDKEEQRDREDPSVLILDGKTVAQLLRKAQKLRKVFTGRGADQSVNSAPGGDSVGVNQGRGGGFFEGAVWKDK